MYQKQTADGYVAQCALKHEKGEFPEALELCLAALDTYTKLNALTKVLGVIIPSLKEGLLWADVAQTTVLPFFSSISYDFWFSSLLQRCNTNASPSRASPRLRRTTWAWFT